MGFEDLTIEDVFPILIMTLFGVLFVFLLVQTIKQKRNAPYLLTSIFFGFLAGLIQFLTLEAIFKTFYIFDILTTFKHQLNLSAYALMIFFFYLFLEDLTDIKPNIMRFSIIFGLLILDLLPLWQLYWFDNKDVSGKLWVLTDAGYDFLGFCVFAIFGLWVYIKTFKYSKDGRAISLAISMIIVGIGYAGLALYDLNDFFDFLAFPLGDLKTIGGAISIIGLLIMVLSYVTNVNYLYRLPNDNYVLTVAYKSGVPIHTVEMQTSRKKVSIEQEMLTGLISAISTMFRGTLQSDTDIENIKSKDATILVESGARVICIIVSDHVSATLSRALKRYVREFESMFEKELGEEALDSTKFEPANDLLKRVFPFFKIKKDRTN
ncbi:MAG: hypothetical protein ACFFCS_14060 [Candidatus Hodarchaeota archaeon]